MRPEELEMVIAEHVGWAWYAVEKAGWYYRQGGCGYTNRIEEAGRYTREQAEKELVRGEPMQIVQIPHPPYSRSLDALHEALQSLTELELFRYADEVCDLTCDSNHDTDIQTMLMLSAKELAECYVRAIGKWRGA